MIELQAGRVAFDPADLGLEHLERVELDPHAVADARHFDQLHPAPLARKVEHAHAIADLAGRAEADLARHFDPVCVALDLLPRRLERSLEIESGLTLMIPAHLGGHCAAS